MYHSRTLLQKYLEKLWMGRQNNCYRINWNPYKTRHNLWNGKYCKQSQSENIHNLTTTPGPMLPTNSNKIYRSEKQQHGKRYAYSITSKTSLVRINIHLGPTLLFLLLLHLLLLFLFFLSSQRFMDFRTCHDNREGFSLLLFKLFVSRIE